MGAMGEGEGEGELVGWLTFTLDLQHTVKRSYTCKRERGKKGRKQGKKRKKKIRIKIRFPLLLSSSSTSVAQGHDTNKMKMHQHRKNIRNLSNTSYFKIESEKR